MSNPIPASLDYKSLLKDVHLWLFPLGLGGAAFSIFTTFGPLLLHRKYGLDETTSEIALALWILVGALAAFFFGRLSGRFGRLRTLTVSYALVAAACLASVPFGNVGIVLALFWTLGSAVFITYPALFSFISESSRRRLLGASFGLIFGVQILGGSLGSFGAGILADRLRSIADLESTAPFYLLGLLALAGFAYLVAIRRRIEDRHAKGSAALTAL